MGDIILKFQLKDILNCIIEEDLSEYLKLKIKDKQYSAAYENDSIYKFEVPDTEKNFNFQLSLEHEDYDNKIYNTSESSLVYSNTVCNFINKYNIPVVYACKKSEKYTIIELKAYHLDDNFNKLFNDNYERYFYKGGSFIELEVKLREDKVIDEDKIQWGIISWYDLYSIEKENNHEFFSNEYSSAIQKELHEKFKSFTYDIIEKKGSRYICELPNYQQDEPHELYIFAYISEEEITKYNSVKLCINDYTQVVIDVTLAEALKANNEVAQLGWATSYVLQRLWHDNPSNEIDNIDKIDSLEQLILKNKNDVIKVTKNKKMKDMISKLVPDIEIKMYPTKDEIEKEYKITLDVNNDEMIDALKYKFYITLGWESFYIKFPVVQDIIRKSSYEIYTSNFKTSFTHFIYNCSDMVYLMKSSPYEYDLTVKFNGIYNNLKDNNEIFDLYLRGFTRNRKKDEQFLYMIKEPYLLNGRYMQRFDFDNIYFAKSMNLSYSDMFLIDYDDVKTNVLNEKNALKNISLYSVTGKFSVYFIVESFKANMIHRDKVGINVLNMKSYIYDAFDFNDSPEQSVGVWDYFNMNFDILNSVKEVAYQKSLFANIVINNSLTHIQEVDKVYVYNSNYIAYKKSVNKGFDYRIFSDSFIEFKDKYFELVLGSRTRMRYAK